MKKIISKKIGVTFGDVAGVGPEVILKAITSGSFPVRDIVPERDIVLFGDKKIWEILQHQLKIKDLPPVFFACDLFPDICRPSGLSFSVKEDAGKINKAYGAQAVEWISEAVKVFLKKGIQTLVTAPIHKESCHLAGFPFKGHTDFIASFFGDKPHRMMFYSDSVKLALVSHHLALSQAICLLNKKEITETILLADEVMKQWGIDKPLFLVSGTNPHAGENGAFGREELDIILPAIQKAQKKGVEVKGPFPPDTVFRHALSEPRSMVISMTHDLGLAPFKLLAFESGVNITVGLPLIRTSPDHGTAFDIAWKGRADASSMKSALRLAAKMASSQ